MDRSLGTVAQPRIQDVTPQIQKINMVYGPSDYTNPAYSSSNRSLNYHEGGSIHSPELERVTIIPYTLHYKDTVGLFGKENHFIRVDVKINKSVALACFEPNTYECAIITTADPATQNTYDPVIIDPQLDLSVINTYHPASIYQQGLISQPDSWISVDLENLKTGNKYIDDWFDVRLYTKDREEHPYDKMYTRLNDWFYIGFHARNTKRLPYNVKCVIGREYVSGLPAESQRYKNKDRGLDRY